MAREWVHSFATAGRSGRMISVRGRLARSPKPEPVVTEVLDGSPLDLPDFDLDPPALVHRNIEVAIALIYVALGLWIFAETFTFRASIIKGEMIDETGLPRLVAVIFVVCGTIIATRILRVWRDAPTPYVSSDGGSPDLQGYPIAVWRPWIYFVACVVWAVALPSVGFVVATALLLFVFLFLAQVRSVIKLTAVPLGVPLAIWLLFDRVVGINLPAGPLEELLSRLVPRLF